MTQIWIMHPELPDGQWEQVTEEAMYHLASAGWRPVPDDMLEKREAADEAARAEADAAMAPKGLWEQEAAVQAAMADMAVEAEADVPETVVVPETAEGTGAVPVEEEDED